MNGSSLYVRRTAFVGIIVRQNYKLKIDTNKWVIFGFVDRVYRNSYQKHVSRIVWGDDLSNIVHTSHKYIFMCDVSNVQCAHIQFERSTRCHLNDEKATVMLCARNGKTITLHHQMYETESDKNRSHIETNMRPCCIYMHGVK